MYSNRTFVKCLRGSANARYVPSIALKRQSNTNVAKMIKTTFKFKLFTHLYILVTNFSPYFTQGFSLVLKTLHSGQN